MAEIFKLPASSYEELVKLFQAYSNVKEGTAVTLDVISQATGVPRTVVSKNNGFLVQIGVINSEGNKKSTTEIGRSLGRAYTSKIDYEIDRIWREIIAEVDFLNRMVSAVRIRNGMDRTSLVNHIVYSSGLKDSKENRAGAGAIIEILKSVNVFDESDGKITVKDEKETVSTAERDAATNKTDEKAATFINEHATLSSVSTNAGVMINININCAVDDLDTLGEKIKKVIDQIAL